MLFPTGLIGFSIFLSTPKTLVLWIIISVIEHRTFVLASALANWLLSPSGDVLDE
jgi:hypothetical protein